MLDGIKKLGEMETEDQDLKTTLILELETEKIWLNESSFDWERFKNVKTKYQLRVDLALLKLCIKLKPDISEVLKIDVFSHDCLELYIDFLYVL